MILRFWFERDISRAHILATVAFLGSAYKGHLVLAGAVFLVGVIICAWGELKLERRA